MRTIVGRVLLLVMALSVAAQAEVKKALWGHTADGEAVEIYTLSSQRLEVRVMGFGARLVSIKTPDRKGAMEDIILGYDSLEEYLKDKKTHLGGVVGRYGNRIALGKFSLDGETYQIPVNNGRNALHGGTVGFEQKVWTGHEVPNGVEFTLVSPDGDMGFPGTLTAKVRYTVVGDALRLDYSATTDKDTVVNLTNHAYFNLSGNEREDILNERVILNASQFTPVNEELIPTGELAQVVETPFDFRKPMEVGARIGADNEQLKLAGGYDHNFVLNGRDGATKLAAMVADTKSGRVMTVTTTQPGVQFYSGNHLDGTFTGRHGKKYVEHMALCLETQHFPDSPNEAAFPSTVLKPGQEFHSTTTFRFSVKK